MNGSSAFGLLQCKKEPMDEDMQEIEEKYYDLENPIKTEECSELAVSSTTIKEEEEVDVKLEIEPTEIQCVEPVQSEDIYVKEIEKVQIKAKKIKKKYCGRLKEFWKIIPTSFEKLPFSNIYKGVKFRINNIFKANRRRPKYHKLC